MDDLEYKGKQPMTVSTVGTNREQITKFVEGITAAMELYEYQIQMLKQSIEYSIQDMKSLASLSEVLDEHIDKCELSIADIKKIIKYSKNPLEVLQLQRRLNSLYKKKYR